ncbi:hypothetical protein GOB36_30005 [Sinorhizobium meliloti]|nr:hypothetical protein [Sinorhizobium meliloti]MDX0036007.1 hypothetical protein [Sinorhizobium meliloti]MDX0371938.1 hypothetical protein [Sinorhizobium meliloti]
MLKVIMSSLRCWSEHAPREVPLGKKAQAQADAEEDVPEEWADLLQ